MSAVQVGSVELRAPIMTASGTAGYSTELSAYGDLAQLGAVVVKSLAAFEWAGNPAPRLHPADAGMLNAVGLQGPGIAYWLREDLTALISTGATVVASIWGRTIAEYQHAAELLASAPPQVVAVEINLSCPNLSNDGHGAGHAMFAHDAELTAQVIDVTKACNRPRWAKLSPNTDVSRIIDVARAARDAGAEAITLINTALGMVLDERTGLPALGSVGNRTGGGYSGRPIHPMAVRAVYEVHAALPEVPIVGVGGVTTGWDAAELLLAGASAVQVGTATFADPRAPWRIQRELLAWSAGRDLTVADLTGRAHSRGLLA